MFNTLGIHWASSVPAFLALACLPFPFAFYRYGAAIRKRCPYAAQAEAVMAELRAKVVAAEGPSEAEGAEEAASGSRLSRTTTGETGEAGEAQARKPRYEAIRGTRSRTSEELPRIERMHSRAESIIEAAEYNASPYDIDRVNTADSVAGLELHLTRTNRSKTRSSGR